MRNLQPTAFEMDSTTRSQRRRSQLSEEQAARIREQDTQRRAAARALLSDQQRDVIRQQSRERQRAARQHENDLRRSDRLAADRIRQTHTLQGLSVEQRSALHPIVE